MEANKKFPVLRGLAQAIEIVGYLAGLIVVILGLVLAFTAYDVPSGIKILFILGDIIAAGLLLIVCLLVKEMINVVLVIEYNTHIGCLWIKALTEKFDAGSEKGKR